MAVLATFATVAGSLKTAADTVKTMINLRDAAAFQPKANELQGQISAALADAIAAYEAQTAQLQRIRELEDEVRSLKTWEAEKQRYALQRLPPGIFVYSLKSDMAAGEPPHSICQTCYQRGKKSILHEDETHNGVHNIECAECGTKLLVGHFVAPRSDSEYGSDLWR